MGPAKQAIVDLRAQPGELSFEARIGGDSKRIWFRTETAVTPPADAALAACLMPAMRAGGTLTMTDPVSPRVLRGQREYQAIWRAWSQRWEFPDPPLREVELAAPAREVSQRQPTGRVAAFFSGGVDSWSTVVGNPDLTDLIFMRGVDILPDAAHQEGLAERVEERLREAAGELGLELHVVETNARELADPLVPWEAYYSAPLIATAHFFEPLFDRVLIAGATDFETQGPGGGNRLVCRLWSSERLEVADDGGLFNRMERTARIADHPAAQKSLRVCWENPGGAYNCGHCTKCTAAMVALEVTGKRELFTTFPGFLDLEAMAERVEMRQLTSLVLREDILDAALARGDRPDLVAALEAGAGQGEGAARRPRGPATAVLSRRQRVRARAARPGDRRPPRAARRALLRGADRRRFQTDLVPHRDRGDAAGRRRPRRLPDAGDAGRRHADDDRPGQPAGAARAARFRGGAGGLVAILVAVRRAVARGGGAGADPRTVPVPAQRPRRRLFQRRRRLLRGDPRQPRGDRPDLRPRRRPAARPRGPRRGCRGGRTAGSRSRRGARPRAARGRDQRA